MAHDRIKSKYNVGFDHFIEPTDIMELEDLFEDDEEEEDNGSDEKPKKDAKEKKKNKKA